MGIHFNANKVGELIKERGLKVGYIVKQLETSWTTFGRWMKEETPIPFVKAVELAKLLKCDINDLYKEENK